MNLNEIESDIIKAAIVELIVANLQSQKYELSVSYASQDGRHNFVGIVYRVISKYNGKRFVCIVKVAPSAVTRRENFNTRAFFLQEIFVYNKLLTDFIEFEKEKQIIAVFDEYPRCLHTIDIEEHEALIFEDLTESGYEMLNRFSEVVTADHVNLVMKTLGRFHAISFAMQDQQPNRFTQLTENLVEVFIRPNDLKMRTYFGQRINHLIEILRIHDDIRIMEKVEKIFAGRIAIDVCADDINCKLNELEGVIAHGDTWQNNILFTYDQKRIPNEDRLLDWQLTRYTSPIVDVLFFIFICTTKDVRDLHYETFLNTYYNTLSSRIKELGSDPNKLFPRSRMDHHLYKIGRVGLMMAALLLPMLTSDKNTNVDLENMSKSITNESEMHNNAFISDESRDRFYKRLREVAIDMDRLNYI